MIGPSFAAACRRLRRGTESGLFAARRFRGEGSGKDATLRVASARQLAQTIALCLDGEVGVRLSDEGELPARSREIPRTFTIVFFILK